MKKTNIARALVLAALPIASQGFGQETVVPGSVAKFNFALTLTDSVAAAKEKDENGKVVKGGDIVEENEYSVDKKGVRTSTVEQLTKLAVSKYSVKEFLTDLLEEGIEGFTEIKGWSVVKVQATSIEETGPKNSDPSFYLVKKGATPISLAEYIFVGGTSSEFDRKIAVNGKSTAKFNIVPPVEPEGETTYTPIEGSETLAYTLTQKFLGEFSIGFDEGNYLETQGIYSGTEKLGSTKDKKPVILSGASKLSSLTGIAISTSSEEGAEAEGVIVEGSAALGAGAAADLATYPGFEPEPETVE